jgi:type IX secretion system PorP/SprF family membrane protein
MCIDSKKIAPFVKLLILLILASAHLSAQDFQFSQFYNVPLYQNPAFAGSLHQARIGFHQRLQWPRLDAKYVTSVLSADKYFHNQKSGVGMVIMRDYQGGGQISSTEAQFMYAYEVKFSKNVIFRPGLQLGYVSRHVDYADLHFPYQYNNIQGLVNPQDPQDIWKKAKGYLDVSSGGIIYTKVFWAGFSVHHINTPNQSFQGAGIVSKLPAQFALTSGYKIILYKKVSTHEKDEVSITPTFHYKFQGLSDQLDLGIYGAANSALIGLWYRGIPIQSYKINGTQFRNNESIIVFIGWKGDPLRIGYSYDFTISHLAQARTGGAHELNITYVIHDRKYQKKKKIMKRLPCPSF